MSRHLIFAVAIAVLVATTVLFLADAGVFGGAGRWLFARYEAESLLKAPSVAEASWLRPLAVLLAALLVAWVAVDLSSWVVRGAVLAATVFAVGFLSLTLALYGMAFNPFPALVASGLAMIMGALMAETPETRRRRECHRLLGDRVGEATLRDWVSATDSHRLVGGIREVAVVALRILDPLPVGEDAAAYLAGMRRLTGDARAFLRQRRGVVLDMWSGDSVRAFFGLVPDAVNGDVDGAARAVLDLRRYLKEESALRRETGHPGFTCGIGLAVGPLLTGVHGAESAPFWSASGPAAEQARQLAALNGRHRTAILIGRRAADRLGGRFELEAVEGDAIYALVAPKPEVPPEDSLLTDIVEHETPVATGPKPSGIGGVAVAPADPPPTAANGGFETKRPTVGRRKLKPGS